MVAMALPDLWNLEYNMMLVLILLLAEILGPSTMFTIITKYCIEFIATLMAESPCIPQLDIVFIEMDQIIPFVEKRFY